MQGYRGFSGGGVIGIGRRDDGKFNWVPVVPLSALPKGERRVIIQDGETILLLWYNDDVFAIENRSPAEGAYSEGLLNAKLTQVTSHFLSFFLIYYLLHLISSS